MGDAVTHERARLFSYEGLEIDGDALRAHFAVDGSPFVEVVTFDGLDIASSPAASRLAQVWYLIAGLSYYKTGAATRVDLGSTPIGPMGRRLLAAAITEGLGEFAFRNDLDLSDVEIVGGGPVDATSTPLDATRVLVPFGGGIDSVVTVERINGDIERTLFVVSPTTGRFAPLEATAERTGLDVVRATRLLDPRLRTEAASHLHGHVPVSAMYALLAGVAAVASGRGGVVMSNEHSASSPNLVVDGRSINHQWSKSLDAEVLIAAAVTEAVGEGLRVASFLRDRTEPWVASVFAGLTQYHDVFRSCNRAFRQEAGERAGAWCNECDKCLFIALMLAPFVSRTALRTIFGAESLTDPAREGQLRTLVGLSENPKPFECVGDVNECATSLRELANIPEWRDATTLSQLAHELGEGPRLVTLLAPQGVGRVPADWLR